MLKNNQKPTSNFNCKGLWCILLIAVMVMVTQINIVSATEFDNTISYSKEDKLATFENAYGLPIIGSTIGTAELNTPRVNYVIPGKDRQVMIFTIDTRVDDYSNALKDLEIINMRNGKKTNRDYHWEYAVYETKTIYEYETVCTPGKLLGNGSYEESCVEEVKGSYEKEIVKEWRNLDSFDFVKGKITLALVTDVYKDDHFDGIPTIFGKKVSKWAEWTAALNSGLVHYYNMSSFVDSLGYLDLVEVDAGAVFNDTGCLVGDCVHLDGDNLWNVSIIENYALPHKNISFNYWVNRSNIDNTVFMTKTTPAQINTEGTATVNTVQFASTTLNNPGAFPNNVWVMMTLTRNDTHACFFLNGTLQECGTATDNNFSTQTSLFCNDNAGNCGADGMTGLVDEFSIHNRTLSVTEVTQLYNEGSGITYSEVNFINLNSPEDNFNTTSTSITFNCSGSALALNMVNVSLYVDGTLNRTTNGSAENIYLQETLTSIPTKNHTWYCDGYDSGATQYLSSTRNFNISSYTINNEAYSTLTSEGATEIFEINLTLGIGLQVSTANLIYKNVSYSGTITNPVAKNYSISRTIEVPGITASTNHTFHWDITLDDATIINSTNHNQSVIGLTIDNCSVNTNLLYNFTIVDERTKAEFTAATYNTTGRYNVQFYTLDRSLLIENLSSNSSLTNVYPICISSNITGGSYSVDVQFQYDADGYANEYYHIQNATISGSSLYNNITLYDLSDTESQEFVITYKDSSFRVVSDALVQVQRKYVEEGLFRTVEIPKTDSTGDTVAHLEIADAIYTFIVVKNGEVLSTFTNVLAVCQDIVLGNCDIKLNAVASSTSSSDFTRLDDLTLTLTYDDDTRVLESVFTVPSGTPKTLILNATVFDGLGSSQICSDSLTSSSGTLSCTAPTTFGNGSMIVKITSDGELVAEAMMNMEKNSKDIYGSNIVFLTMFLYLTLIGVGISDNPMVTGVFLLVGGILSLGLNLMSTQAYYGAGATILWLFIAVIMILIKGGNRN